jgi:ABC-type transport system involved in cytochrome c biogenesis permease subunit
MLAYTLLGAAAVMSVLSLTTSFKHMSVLNNLVYAGLAFMTIGMLFGALWAKEAWGHYWAWDPKETWAAITWFSYLGYIHYRLIPNHKEKLALWMLLISFALLQMCWWGIKFLPAAQESSVHVYN